MGRMALSLVVVEAEFHHCARTNEENRKQEKKSCGIGVRAYRAPVEEEDTDYNDIHDTS
jgi:hypothetical protein